MMNKCKDCHWFKAENPFELMSNGKYYPCTNIGVDGWEYWDEYQDEPEHCESFCKAGEYVPTGMWVGLSKVVQAVKAKVDKDADRYYEED